MPLELQIALLRVIEERKVDPHRGIDHDAHLRPRADRRDEQESEGRCVEGEFPR
jgi:hypothetical protein